jgi:CO/xanthine dehydrogenase FAD-binding subunit
MKPAPFAYATSTEIAEVLNSLARYGEEARTLTSGQGLMPLMNMWLVLPHVLVDINRLAEPISLDADRALAIGALTCPHVRERATVI